MRGRRGERVRRPAESGARGRAGRGAAFRRAARGVRAGRCSGAEEGERRREEGKKKKKNGEKKRKWEKGKKKKEKGRGKRERGRCVGADRGDRSHVADRRSSGAGWDSSEEKERSTVSGKKGGTMNEVGC